MSQQDKLFALIKALTPGEKAYFTKYSRIYNAKAKPDYVRLFDFMDSLEVYDEAVIIAHFKEEKFIKQLSRKKTQLRDKVMESLSFFHADRTVEVSLRRQMNVLPVLYEKAAKDKTLIKEYERLIKKIKKEAEKQELFGILIDLFDWERRLVILVDNNKRDSQVVTLLEERKGFTSQLNVELNLEDLSFRTEMLILKDSKIKIPVVRKEFETTVVEVFEKDLKNELSVKAKRNHYYVQSCYYRYLDEWDLACKAAKSLINTYPKKGTIAPYIIKQYKRHLCLYLVVSDYANKRDDHLEIIDKIKRIAPKNDMKTFNTIHFKLLTYHLNTDNFKAALEVAEEVIERWEELCANIPKRRQLSYCYNILVIYWFTGNIKTALYWLNVILNLEGTQNLQRLPNVARVIQLPLYYDCQDKNLENRIESARKVLSQKGALNEYRRAILSSFRKLTRCINQQEKEECILILQKNLLSVKKEHKSTFNDLECLLLWIKLKQLKGRKVLIKS